MSDRNWQIAIFVVLVGGIVAIIYMLGLIERGLFDLWVLLNARLDG